MRWRLESSNILFLALLVSADQLSKWTSHFFLADISPIPVIGTADSSVFFQLNYFVNKGIGFSLFQDLPASFRVPFLLGVAGFVTILLIQALSLSHKPLGKFAVLAIIAGSIGNIIDRLVLGGVIDMIDVGWDLGFTQYDFPVFNFADVYVVCGSMVFLATQVHQFVQEHRDGLKSEEDRISSRDKDAKLWKERKEKAKEALRAIENEEGSQ